jgi:glucose-1-phosphate adenylyltransferase
VGTIGSYYEAHADLVSIEPVFNLYNRRWPILTQPTPLPGAKFVEGGQANESIVAPGCVIAGGVVDHSVLASGVQVHRGARLDGAVILENTRVGRGAVVRRAILDKNIIVPDGAVIGVDHEHDRARGFTVSAEGITVLGKAQLVPPP